MKSPWPARLLTVLLAFSALALGSIHPWAVAICATLSTALFTLVLFSSGLSDRRQTISPVEIAAILLAAFTLLQVVPLPAGLVGLLSPESLEIRRSLHEDVLGSALPAFVPLTIDVPATTLALMKLVPALLTFLAARHVTRTEGSAKVLWCVAISGLLVAIVSLVHRLTGWDNVYDLYEPLYVHKDPLPAPFLNSNHLAGALGMASAVTIGLAFDEEDRYKK